MENGFFLDLLSKGSPLAVAMAIGYWLSERSKTKRDLSYYFGFIIIGVSFFLLVIITVFQLLDYYPEQTNAFISFLLWVFSLRNTIIATVLTLLVIAYRSFLKWRAEREKREFSFHLDKIVKNRVFSSNGIIFLKEARNYPPFLGNYRSVLSPKMERIFTDHFEASDFKQDNSEVIRGGLIYTGRSGDTPESVAEKVYGNKKFASKIPYFKFSNGSKFKIPFVDTNETRNLSSNEIEATYSKASVNYIEHALKELIDQNNLIESEAMPLLRIVYDAAKKCKSK
jgi:hypothetical protein